MNKPGKFYGVGIGPGDPQLLTLRAKQVLEQVGVIFVPKADAKKESLAGNIISQVIATEAEMLELVFPMTKDRRVLEGFWGEAADKIGERISRGQEAAFVTLGDPLMYSTYIYLLGLMKKRCPKLKIETIPGVTSYSAAAASANLPLVEGDDRLAIVPVCHHMDNLPDIISGFETTVLMKIGKRLDRVIDTLEDMGLIEHAVFISRVGDKNECVETDLRRVRGSNQGYLSIIIVRNPNNSGLIHSKTTSN